MIKEYQLIYNESHSWIKVPIQDVNTLDLKSKISRYSKIKGDFYYLETDHDAEIFKQEALKNDWNINISFESSDT